MTSEQVVVVLQPGRQRVMRDDAPRRLPDARSQLTRRFTAVQAPKIHGRQEQLMETQSGTGTLREEEEEGGGKKTRIEQTLIYVNKG